MSSTTPPAALTLTQARRVIWPFNRKRGLAGRTIGELLDAGQLIQRDLEWAAANARSRGLQNACHVLLEHTHEMPVAVIEDEPRREEPATALILEPPDIQPEPLPPVRWQDLIPPDFALQLPRDAPKPEPIRAGLPGVRLVYSARPLVDNPPSCGLALQ